MFRTFRQWAKGYLYLDIIFTGAWYAAVAVCALIALVVAVATGNLDDVPEILLTLAAIGGLFCFAGWITRDARRTVRQLRQQRRERSTDSGETIPPGDMSEIAGIPRNPPWMG